MQVFMTLAAQHTTLYSEISLEPTWQGKIQSAPVIHSVAIGFSPPFRPSIPHQSKLLPLLLMPKVCCC